MYANFGTRGVIRVYNADGSVDKMMKKYGARKIANECTYVYRTVHGKEINISTQSLAIELLGHVLPDKLLTAEEVKNFILNQPIGVAVAGLLKQLVRERTDVIDCGEKHLDGNRFIWDKLASAYEKISRFIEELM